MEIGPTVIANVPSTPKFRLKQTEVGNLVVYRPKMCGAVISLRERAGTKRSPLKHGLFSSQNGMKRMIAVLCEPMEGNEP